MAVNPSPFGPKPQFFDQSGSPDLGYKMFFYVAGSTSTKQDTFTDSTGSVPNTNPILLNALGQTPNELWFTEGLLYKVVLAPATDTDPPTNPVWTIDNLSGQNDGSGPSNSDEWVLYSSAPTYVSPTIFTVTGNQTDIFQVNRRIRAVNDGGIISYGTIISSVYGAVTTVTLLNTFGALDSGLSSVSYGILAPINSSIPATYGTIANLQAQTNIAFTTGGSSTAYTLTPNPALTSLAENQRFQVEFNVENTTTTPTLSISGLLAKPIKVYDTKGNEIDPFVGQFSAGSKHDIVDAGTNYVVMGLSANIPIQVRQSIQYGPTTGVPAVSNLIPQSQIGSTLAAGVTVKFSTKATLLSIANGFNIDGSPNNVNVILNSDLVLTGLTANSTNLVVYDRTNNVLVKTTVLDTDTKGGTPGVTNGLYTLDYENWIMYLGNGTSANPVQHIILAEVDTNATIVTAIRCRAYLRSFLSPYTNTLPGVSTAVSFTHNIGTTTLQDPMLFLECITADAGFSPGEKLSRVSSLGGGVAAPISMNWSRSFVGFATSTTNAVTAQPKGGGALAVLTAANWRYAVQVRGAY